MPRRIASLSIFAIRRVGLQLGPATEIEAFPHVRNCTCMRLELKLSGAAISRKGVVCVVLKKCM